MLRRLLNKFRRFPDEVGILADNWPAPRNKPLAYPGSRPDYSYLLHQGRVHRLAKHDGGLLSTVCATTNTRLNDFLDQAGKSRVDERIAVLGYGSNPVPGQLVSKFDLDATVPVIRATIQDSDLVYNLISDIGYAFAEILLDVPGVQADVEITFLDRTQLERLCATEQNYHLARFPKMVMLETGDELGGDNRPVYFFAGFRPIWIPKSLDAPVAIAEFPVKNRLHQPLTQFDTLKLAIDDLDLGELGVVSVDGLVTRLREEASLSRVDDKLKTLIQKRVEDGPTLPSTASYITPLEIEDARPVIKEYSYHRENSLLVKPTGTIHRKYARGDYIISVSRETKKRLGLGWFAVVSRRTRYTGPDDLHAELRSRKVNLAPEFRIHARVIVFSERAIERVKDEDTRTDMKVGLDEVRMDQSIRNAIGIPFKYEGTRVTVWPINMTRWRRLTYSTRYLIANFLGFRYFFYRVCSAHIHDMEKGICRVPTDTFPILGTDAENKLVFESPVENTDNPRTYRLVTLSIASHELTSEILDQRKKNESLNETRWLKPSSWLPEANPDIDRVFIDATDRDNLGIIQQMSPIKARRDIADLLLSQILGVGLFFFVSIISIGALWPLEKSWTNFTILLLFGVLLATLLMIILLRSRIK
jgi:hypothetical protein